MSTRRALADRLYRAHAEELARYATRLSGDPERAADALHETFVRFLLSPAVPENPRAWLFRVITNVTRDGHRSTRRRERFLSRVHVSVEPAQDPLRDLEAAEVARSVHAALLTLRTRERIAVLMREEGFKHREIADTIGTTTATIGTLLARAFDKLARALPMEGP